MADVTLQDGETVENALHSFKRQVIQDNIIRRSQKTLLLLEARPETPR